ncbi:hypothetical protein SEA_PICARD_44 [Streptomyces phage Picard]|uniref:Uncharacterized protein n=1 Tax=Streptomyces phage Picard TaxID=1920311 RepID=A0A1J0MCK6_9CAUD|nr:hypothetical protein HOR45_gp44 [Streptomyces phage Picard]APD18574.1 hypothetical protein SEA_PICARD_44 [Streptomyces phage Picard]
MTAPAAAVAVIRAALEDAARDVVDGPADAARRVAAELARSGWAVRPAHAVTIPGTRS